MNPSESVVGRLRILIVAGLVSAGRSSDEDRSLGQLVRSLLGQCRDSDLSILSTDPRSPASVAAAYRAQGIDVVGWGSNWADCLADRPYRYSHVFFTDSALGSEVDEVVTHTQPQAAKVLSLSTLPFRKTAALVPITPLGERDGLEFVLAHAESSFVARARSADAVWCDRPADAAVVAALVPSVAVACIPPMIEEDPRSLPAEQRRGMVVVATRGYDVLSGDEDAAICVVQLVLPALLRRGLRPECTLVTDWPSPMLEADARAGDVTIVGADQLNDVLRRSRVALVAHPFGVGGGAIIDAALGAGIPFVATPQAADGLSLGELAPLAIGARHDDLAEMARRLLADDVAWTRFRDVARRFVAQGHSPTVRWAAVAGALPELGVVPARPLFDGYPSEKTDDWPADSFRRARRPTDVALRPEGTPVMASLEGPEPVDAAQRYQRWCARFGPNPGVLRAIETELGTLPRQPLISVVVSAGNPDAHRLNDTLDSVQAQIYDNWQLCIAVDGSNEAATQAVRDAAQGDPRVVVVTLPGPSGPSAATNAALERVEGEWVAFVDAGDVLKAHALAQIVRWVNADPALELIYSDEDKLDAHGDLVDPRLKPHWSPDQLMSENYINRLTVARRSLIDAAGGLRADLEDSPEYDLVLRLVEWTNAIGHIPEPLYTSRTAEASGAATAKPDTSAAARQVLDAALERRGLPGRAEGTRWSGIQRTRYEVPGQPKVSIIIPTRNGVNLLRRCIDSIFERSTYPNYEILIIDNQSNDGETLEYLARFEGSVIRYPYAFNYARMMNLGAHTVGGQVLLFLNNDTEVITPDWIQALLEHAMRPEVGAVGGRLYFPDGRPQHEGIFVGVYEGWAANIDHRGFQNRGDMVRNTSAVTGACTMIRSDVYREVGGNDERLRVAYNDVDLCLRIRQAGLHVVYTPYAELYHHENATLRGYEHPEDGPRFVARWRPRDLVDPFYSPLFVRERLFEIEI